MSRTGTHDLRDLRVITAPVTQFGMEDVQAAVQAELATHNALYQGMLADYATPVTARELAEGTGSMLQGVMEPADEYARVRTQKDGNPEKVGLPLDNLQYSIGFTAMFLRKASVAEVATRALGATKAHRAALIQAMRAALFNPTNRTVQDYLVDNISLNVKALFNGDSITPPNGPNGETFAGSHNHYLAVATGNTIAAADLDALILTVAEHNGDADVRLHINIAQESQIRGVTGFIPAVDSRIVPANTQTVMVAPLTTGNRGNRLFGYYNGAELWVKPWVPSGYVLAVDVNAPVKALGLREPEQAGERGLIQRAENVVFPLQSMFWEAQFGFGARNRSAAAVLYVGGTTYAVPSGL